MKYQIILICSGLFFLVVSFSKATKVTTLIIRGKGDSTISSLAIGFKKTKTANVNLAAHAQAELQAYLDTLVMDPGSVGLMKDAKAVKSIISSAAGNINLSDPFADPADPDDGTFFPMGPWDSAGVPTYLEASPHVISAQLLTFLKTALPEKAGVRKLYPQYMASTAASDLVVTHNGDVFITFMRGSAGHLNTVGYYTYPTNDPPHSADDITEVHYIFPNASAPGAGGNLEPGSKVKLGTFTAGTSIGFILLPNAYNYSSQTIGTGGPKFYSTTACNPETNPELKKHTILLAAPQNRFCIAFKGDNDNDFNDVIILASSYPVAAMSFNGILQGDKNSKR